MRTLQKEYGGIFSMNIGYKRVIMMSDFDKVQERNQLYKMPTSHFCCFDIHELFEFSDFI